MSQIARLCRFSIPVSMISLLLVRILYPRLSMLPNCGICPALNPYCDALSLYLRLSKNLQLIVHFNESNFSLSKLSQLKSCTGICTSHLSFCKFIDTVILTLLMGFIHLLWSNEVTQNIFSWNWVLPLTLPLWNLSQEFYSTLVESYIHIEFLHKMIVLGRSDRFRLLILLTSGKADT